MEKAYFDQLVNDAEFRGCVIDEIHLAMDDVLSGVFNGEEIARLLNNYASLLHKHLPNCNGLNK